MKMVFGTGMSTVFKSVVTIVCVVNLSDLT